MPKNILIIDSDEGALSYTLGLLTEAKYKAIPVTNFQHALGLLEKIAIDLILCATFISNTSGFSFLQKLGQRQKSALVPFIFVAKEFNKEEINLAASLGADGYIFKPINKNVLLSTVEKKLMKSAGHVSKAVILPPSHLIEIQSFIPKKLTENDYVLRTIDNRPTFIKIGGIKYISAQNTYSQTYLADGRTYKVKRTLTEVEKILPENKFIRIHRSHIINLDFVDRIERWFNNSFRVYLKNESEPLEMSRRFSAIIKERFYF